jgi:ribosomal protein L11 methyltransferase
LRVSQALVFAQSDRVIKNLHRWTRLSSVKWEDAWTERLRFLEPEQLAFITWPDSRALKIEAYCDEKTAGQLVKRFGGRATKIAPHIWTGDPARPRAPLSIRGKLKVYSDEPTWQEWRESAKKPPGILVPAGMAFGTGEHATTATCLRLLADLASELPAGFRAVDLGTGSGILAIAAEVFGAAEVEAIDYDPAAVRIAKQNARKNRTRKIAVAAGDVLEWKPGRRFDVVLANLFSEVLISATPRIARATKPGGWFIFSGVLKKQAPEVAAALQKNGFSKPSVIPRGKWCAGICRLSRKS